MMVSNSNEIFLTPDYMLNFKCIGKDCIDSCCTGWNIEIDKDSKIILPYIKENPL